MLLVEINELNITDLLLWIIVQRLKLINVEHIIFECRAREDRVDVNNGCWWQKLSVTIITLVTTLVSLNLRPGFIRNFFLAFLLFWRRFGSTCSQTLLQVLIFHLMWYHKNYIIWFIGWAPYHMGHMVFIWYDSYGMIQFIW